MNDSTETMKVVILAGGFGTRISEESHSKPKPMIEIGDKPMLWHIMKIYSYYGYNDFIICLGYKGHYIKEYFYHYYLHESVVTFDLSKENEMFIHNSFANPWRVTLVDTGKETMTGGRLKRVQEYIGDKTFMLTYGDGVSDINIQTLVEYHRSHGKWTTITATQPSGRFGALKLDKNDSVTEFTEKPSGDGGWVNAGFFVMEPQVFQYITGDHTNLEKDTLETIAKESQLIAFKHSGFWHPMDTLRDKNYLEELWKSNKALWKREGK